MPTVCYTAPVVCPMAGPPLANGAVLVTGDRIAAVGDAASLSARADRTHHVGGVLLPGLVNGHAHLEQTDAHGLARSGPHHAWLEAVEGAMRDWGDDKVARSARRGVQHLLRAGVTTSADVVTRGPAVPAAVRAGLAGDSLVEVAMAGVEHADAVLAGVERALRLPAEGRRVGIAVTPATVGTGVLQSLAALAARRGVPLHVLAALTSAEVAAVRTGEGPLAERARARGLDLEWLDAPTGYSPVRYLDACGALLRGGALIHGVAVDATEARLLAERGVTVVCCPRQAGLQRAGDSPLDRYAEAGTLLALGTGSAAAVGTLDLLADAAAWVAQAGRCGLAFWPSVVGPVSLEEQAVRLLTVDGARALGWGDRAGVLEPGRRADFVVLDVQTTPEDAYRDLVRRGAGRQVLTVLGGVRKARRDSAAEPWPPIETEDER
jgi:aminodeoxyfutalosine deaminase